MPLVFRSMVPDESGRRPRVANDANSLGVRVLAETGDSEDIPVFDGLVRPGRAGMSVAPSAELVPIHRVPRRFKGRVPDHLGVPGGKNTAVCWRTGDGPFIDSPFDDGLLFRNEPEGSETHGVICPEAEVLLASFRDALARTKTRWESFPWPWEQS
jgi:hypothetical protein